MVSDGNSIKIGTIKTRTMEVLDLLDPSRDQLGRVCKLLAVDGPGAEEQRGRGAEGQRCRGTREKS